MHYVN